MPCLTREAIAKADDLPREKVKTPEWGKDSYVFVRTMSGDQRDDFEASFAGDAKSNLRGRLAALTVCDDEGNLLFAGSDGAELLGGKSARVLDRIFAVAIRLNAISKTDVDALEKN
jgi:hypothetical protein